MVSRVLLCIFKVFRMVAKVFLCGFKGILNGC